ncbi:MAG: flagellar protein FlaG [Caulobacteraceae bacterium]
MKIDANVSSTLANSFSNASRENVPVIKTSGSESANIEQQSYVDIAHKPNYEMTMDEKAWIQVIEKANKAISGAMCSFEFSIHEKTKEIMVKVLDKDTGKIIREIPPEKILDMVAKMWEMAGILVDERR